MKIELLINKEMTICVGQYAGCPTYTHELGHTPKSAPFYRKLKFDEEIIVEVESIELPKKIFNHEEKMCNLIVGEDKYIVSFSTIGFIILNGATTNRYVYEKLSKSDKNYSSLAYQKVRYFKIVNDITINTGGHGTGGDLGADFNFKWTRLQKGQRMMYSDNFFEIDGNQILKIQNSQFLDVGEFGDFGVGSFGQMIAFGFCEEINLKEMIEEETKNKQGIFGTDKNSGEKFKICFSEFSYRFSHAEPWGGYKIYNLEGDMVLQIDLEPNCDPSNHFFRQEHYRNGRFLNLLLEKFNIIFN